MISFLPSREALKRSSMALVAARISSHLWRMAGFFLSTPTAVCDADLAEYPAAISALV